MRVLALLLLLAVSALGKRFFNGDQVLRVQVEAEEQVQLLQALEDHLAWEVDFWIHPVSAGRPVEVRVGHASLSGVKEYLQTNNIRFYVMINDLQELLDEQEAEMEESESRNVNYNFGAYQKLETIYRWMDTLVSEHPNLVTKFSTGGTKRPAIWIDTGIHSREWIATDYGTDASLTSLLNTMDIYMLLLANPDGYSYSHTNDRMWRKTRSRNSGSRCRGVDPNRNWDAGFGGPGSSRNPCSDSYHGTSAHSEVEVRNVVNLIKAHGNFKSFISIHAFSQLLMYPYGYTCQDIPDKAELESVGRAAVQKLTSLYGTTYKVGNICKIIYQASGGSIDWSYNAGIKYSYAFELRDTGRYGFLLPANQIIPTASETWLALKHIMEHVRDHPY
ncbi:hypothetical protein NHX12_002731 [Muraenolepis orangiensis]|uniref:Peptidase M14 domain-containing protein n=1 Tax=Muraenolepis orangiensis TaxID=630683 RepID=A0A9Q0IDA8_9TELE|nr:hypothetical protein NHX12_002731 [Muraenolepis orangiensis]